MASLPALPNELLAGIFLRLKTPDLAKISLVCRQLRIVAEPFLYRVVSLDIRHEWPRSRYHIFLLTILNRPVLVNCVEELSLKWSYSLNCIRDPAEHPDVAMEWTRFRAAALSFRLGHQPLSHGPQLLLLLHLLPRLHVLNIIAPGARSIFFDLMEKQAFLPRPRLPIGLQSLREFTCFFSDMHSGISPSMLLGLCTLPSIRVLDVRLIREMQITNQRDHTQVNLASPDYVGTSNVTDLRFGYGDVSALSLTRILPIPRALTRFSYGERAAGGRREFNVGEFRVALQSVKGTLQSLAICFDQDEELGFRELYPELQIIGPLWDWPALTQIRCPLSLLLGKDCVYPVGRLVDVLPRVIRDVRIEWDWFWPYEENIEQIVEMLELKDVCGLHKLAVVRIDEKGDIEKQMNVVCDAAGVELVVVRLV